MFAVLSKFTVDAQSSMIEAVKRSFVERPHLVDNIQGFVKLDVLSPVDSPNEIWLLTYWSNRADFELWYRSHHYKDAHSGLPAGLKLVGDRTELLFFEHIAS